MLYKNKLVQCLAETIRYLRFMGYGVGFAYALTEAQQRQEMENITASEVAGFGVGTLLLCATIAAPKVDAFISASQRSSLGLCKRCGDLRMTACSRCRGTGLIKGNGPFSFNLIDDLYQSFANSELKVKSIGCTNCQARGHFSCPDCSGIPKL